MNVFFPSKEFIVNQSAGIDKATGENRFASSHEGYKAIDINVENRKLYAPCDLECIYHARVGFKDNPNKKSALLTVFRSVEQIECVDKTKGNLLLYCTHGGVVSETDSEIALKLGKIFKKGKPFYAEGKDNGFNENGEPLSVGQHIHINAGIGDFDGFNSFANSVQGYLYLPNEKYIEDVFYLSEDGKVTFNSNYIDAYPFEFKKYVSEPFDPTGKKDGWYEHNGLWYYVISEQKAKGWQQIEGCWYYLDPENDCIMKTGWLCTKDKETNKEEWYYFGPSGVMQGDCWVDNDNYYVGSDGKMLTSGWTEIDGYFYYFKDKYRDTTDRFAAFAHGQKVTNTWIPGESWYYVKSDGKMAANETVNIDGTDYHFDQSGACLNP